MTLVTYRRLALALGLFAVASVTATIAFAAGEGRPPQSSVIDDKLAEKWKANDLKAAQKSTDLQFMRRLFLDVIGRIPTLDEAREFDHDTAADKRSKLISRLLHEKEYKIKGAKGEVVTFHYTEEYARHWANVWTVWLMTRGGLDRMYHEQMENWLETQFDKNVPYNELVDKLITATGKTNDNAAVNFVLSHMGENVPQNDRDSQGKFDFVPLTSRVTRLFLGVQVQCTQCHDHPFNPEWTQENFWGINAFLRQIDRSGTPLPAVGGNKKMMATNIEITDNSAVNAGHRTFYEKRSGVLMSIRPTMISGLDEKNKDIPRKVITTAGSKTRRQLLSEYIAGHDNFNKAIVNRMWGQFFGRGLNEQSVVDDFGGHNKLVHPELLETLADDFGRYKYDLKSLIEWICNSNAYQLSYSANESNAKDEVAPYFSRMALKSMSPEELYTSILRSTGSEAKSDEVKADRDIFLGKLVRQFGDDEGNEQSFNGTVVQALLLMNGKEINGEIQKGSTIERSMKRHDALLKSNPSAFEAAVIDDIFMAVLTRHVRRDLSVNLRRRYRPQDQEKDTHQDGKRNCLFARYGNQSRPT